MPGLLVKNMLAERARQLAMNPQTIPGPGSMPPAAPFGQGGGAPFRPMATPMPGQALPFGQMPPGAPLGPGGDPFVPQATPIPGQPPQQAPMPPGVPFGPSSGGPNPMTSAGPGSMPPGVPFGPSGGPGSPPIPMSKPQPPDVVPAKVAQVLAKAPEAQTASVDPKMASQQFPISVGQPNTPADPKQVALQALTATEPSMTKDGDTSPVNPTTGAKADSSSPWANPDFGSLIRSIGIGLLTSNDPWSGLGKGLQNFENTQRLNAATDREEKWKQKEFDQKQTQIDNTAGDQREDRLSREKIADNNLNAENKRLLFQARQAVDMENLRSQHESERLGQQGAQARSLAAYNQQLDNNSPQGQLAAVKAKIAAEKGYDPDDPNARNNALIKQNGEVYKSDTDSYISAGKAIDSLNRLEQIAPKADIGPDIVHGFKRLLSTTLGIGESDVNTEVGYNSAIQQFASAVQNMKGYGQITEPERELIRQGIADPAHMTRDTFMKIIQIQKGEYQNTRDMRDAWRALPPSKQRMEDYLNFKSDYDYNLRRTPEGNPASGKPQGNSTSTGDPEFDKMLGL